MRKGKLIDWFHGRWKLVRNSFSFEVIYIVERRWLAIRSQWVFYMHFIYDCCPIVFAIIYWNTNSLHYISLLYTAFDKICHTLLNKHKCQYKCWFGINMSNECLIIWNFSCFKHYTVLLKPEHYKQLHKCLRIFTFGIL